jgi:hypothetical protein
MVRFPNRNYDRLINKANEKLVRPLLENGMEVTLDDIKFEENYRHNVTHEEDVFCASILGPAGYYFRYGIHVPAGQNIKEPAELLVFCSLEELQGVAPPYSDGFRLSHDAVNDGWQLFHWSVTGRTTDLGSIRRDFLGEADARLARLNIPKEKVPLILARIAQLYMKGA